jgi:hypothetical protein
VSEAKIMSTPSFTRIMKSIREFGPYLLVELFLPGGTLVALLLWLAQRRKPA